MAVIVIYVDGSMFESLHDVNYEVQSDGLLATSTSPKPSSMKFTYSGVNTLLGYSTSSSAVSPDTNFSVGDTGTISSSVTLYSVQQEPVDITISYKGSTIATMSSSGTKILNTSGTYCEDDITIDYTKTGMTVVETLDPNGGTIVSISGDPVTSLQAKTVIPTSQSQTISADSGYDAISEVLVQGDSNLIGSNIASGISIFGVVGTFAGGGGGSPKDFIEQHGTMTSFTDSTISVIGSGAFAYCASLTTVSLPLCTSIGSYAFYYCSKLTTASFPSCTFIGSYAFSYCSSLTTVSFPLCTYIGGYAFYYCSKLTTASFPSCTFIRSYAFQNCSKLTTVSFPSCTSIDVYAFYNCYSLTTISFPSCTSIGNYAFYSCSSLTTVSFPSCTSIGTGAFQSCLNLTTANFPSCVSIGSYVFRTCYSLLSLYLTGSSIAFLSNSNAFSSTPIAGYTTYTGGVYGSIFVPSSLYSTYIASTNWTYFSSRFVSV